MQKTYETGLGIDRRDVLKSMGTIGALSIIGIPAIGAGRARATSHETLYMSSSVPITGGQETTIFSVTLDESGPEAVLSEVYTVTDG